MSTWQNLESPRGQISGHVCEGVSWLYQLWKTHSKCWQHHFMDLDLGLNKKEKVNWVPALISSRFLMAVTEWLATSDHCCYDFIMLYWTIKISPSFLKLLWPCPSTNTHWLICLNTQSPVAPAAGIIWGGCGTFMSWSLALLGMPL